MFPVAVVCTILGYTLIYCGFANLGNGGQGPSVWEALGWGPAPAFPLDGKLGSGAGSAAGKALEKLLPKTPSANPVVPPTYTQL